MDRLSPSRLPGSIRFLDYQPGLGPGPAFTRCPMSKQLKLSTLIAALGVFLVTPLLAQQKGTWEIGGFARYNWYDQSFDQSTANKRKNSWGGGARVGYFFS